MITTYIIPPVRDSIVCDQRHSDGGWTRLGLLHPKLTITFLFWEYTTHLHIHHHSKNLILQIYTTLNQRLRGEKSIYISFPFVVKSPEFYGVSLMNLGFKSLEESIKMFPSLVTVVENKKWKNYPAISSLTDVIPNSLIHIP